MRKSRILLCILILLTIHGASHCLVDNLKVGQTCSKDDQCDPPYLICSTGKCKHKPLFPMTSTEIYSIFFIVGFSIIGVVVGVGSGTVLVPLTIMFIGFTTQQSVALTNGVTLMASIVKYIMGIFLMSPITPYKTIVDYNCILVMLPMMTLFSTFGGIVANFVPGILIIIILLASHVACIVIGYRSYTQQKGKEFKFTREMFEKARYSSNPYAELKDLPLESPRPSPSQISGFKAMSIDRSPLTNQKQAEIDRQLVVESSNFVPKKILPIVFIMVLSIIVGLLRGAKGSSSIVGITYCSKADFLVLGGYTVLLSLMQVICSWIVIEEQNRKERIGWPRDPSEKTFTTGEHLFTIFWGAVTGFMLSMLGGGVFLAPYLLIIGFMPVTTAWTLNTLMVVSKAAAVIINYMTGDILVDYTLFYGLFITLGMLVNEKVLVDCIKRTNSQIFYPIALIVIMTVALTTTFYVGYSQINEGYYGSAGKSTWKFGSFCT